MYWREANSDFDAVDADWNYEPPRAEVFQQIAAPLYTVDADGWLTYYNDAAAALWGLRPELGKARWCGAWCLYRPNGTVLPHDCGPIATALKERCIVRPSRMLLERPDETKVLVRSYPTLLRDAAGAVIAAFDVLQPVSQPDTQGRRGDDRRPYSRWPEASATALRRCHA